jgi:hypothetical protein
MNLDYRKTFAFYMWAIGKAVEESLFQEQASKVDSYFEDNHTIYSEEEIEEENHFFQIALFESFMEDEICDDDSVSADEIALIKKWACKRPDARKRRTRYIGQI